MTLISKFDSAYSALWETVTAPVANLFTSTNLPKTVSAIMLVFMMASCHQSIPYTTEQSVRFIDTASISGLNEGVPSLSSKQPKLTSDDSLVLESPQAYTQRAKDSIKNLLIEKANALTTPPPIESDIVDTLPPLVHSPAALPAKKIKSPAEKAAIAKANPQGLPAESVAGTKIIDHANSARPLVPAKKKVAKPVYDCGCTDKVVIQPNTTPTSFVAVYRGKYPKMTISSLTAINKPNVVKNWKQGIAICLKRAAN